jgi:HTH-type transcriptional regulator/antitoxin HigA
VADYERIEAAQLRQLTAGTLEELPEVLIKARIAEKLTQKELAQRLGMQEQQIQRYEADRFRSASLHRLIEIAKALRLRCKIEAEVEGAGGIDDARSNADRQMGVDIR